MSAIIMALQPKDRVRQESEPIAMIYRTMGTQAAEEVVNRALAELALTMAGLVSQVRDDDLGDLSRKLRRLTRMADQMGMVSLGLVAADVRHCLDQGDLTAFSAVWARLIRVAESCLATGNLVLDLSK